MKFLDGKELAGFVKERQRLEVLELLSAKRAATPKLVIFRDNSDPVITKYVELKKAYGADIGVAVEDVLVGSVDELKERIAAANANASVSGVIVQLPLLDPARTDEMVALIAPEKDVDGLAGGVEDLRFVRDFGQNGESVQKTPDEGARRVFDSATATAINWLLTGYDITLAGKKIALVGRGRLVGAPLFRMFHDSGLDVAVFGHDSDLSVLRDFDVIITATGVAGLIRPEMIRENRSRRKSDGAVVVDAGTASEGGKLVGDLDPAVYARSDLAAITPAKGGVGPLTVAVLFDNVIRAAKLG